MINGLCLKAIFNLNVPLKKLFEEVTQNLPMMQERFDDNGINVQIRARQLYHDREEVTVHVRRIWAAAGGRRDER